MLLTLVHTLKLDGQFYWWEGFGSFCSAYHRIRLFITFNSEFRDNPRYKRLFFTYNIERIFESRGKNVISDTYIRNRQYFSIRETLQFILPNPCDFHPSSKNNRKKNTFIANMNANEWLIITMKFPYKMVIYFWWFKPNQPPVSSTFHCIEFMISNYCKMQSEI